MQLQPSDLYQFIPIRKENDEIVCNKTLSVLFSILNFLDKGQSIESDNITIESLGNNLLHISSKITPTDIKENMELDFSVSQGIY